MRRSLPSIPSAALLVAILFAATVSLRARQTFSNLDREQDRAILRDARDAVKKHYYDPKFHGVDLDGLFAQYDEKIKASQSNHEALSQVAAFLEKLDDSHTFFVPPSRVARVDYGYRMQMIGNDCFITRVRPGTDAAAKVHPGDLVLTREGFAVNRADLSTLLYFYESLAPKGVSNLDLRDPSGQERRIEVNAKVRETKRVSDLAGGDRDTDIWDTIREEESEEHVMRDRIAESGDVAIWKMPWFFADDQTIVRFFGIARKHKTLILDLRGNPGGDIDVLESMLGHVFDHEVKIADRISRKESKPLIAKSRGGDVFSGNLIVLVDSDSASAAELFARVVQLENRGVVLGDRSSGKVMEARVYPYSQGEDIRIFYDFEVTDADLIMKDGKSLEKNGVVPAEISLPTAADLASGRDPVLSGAAALAGVKLDPVEAGKMFPFEWAPL